MDNELIRVLAEKFNLAFDFVQDNLPVVMEQFIKYKITMNTIGIIITSVIFLAAWFIVFIPLLVNKNDKALKHNKYYDNY